MYSNLYLTLYKFNENIYIPSVDSVKFWCKILCKSLTLNLIDGKFKIRLHTFHQKASYFNLLK